MSIERLKKEIEQIKKDPKKKALSDKLEIDHLRDQIEIIEYNIENGNWEGYEENLRFRKKKLKEMKAELDEKLK